MSRADRILELLDDALETTGLDHRGYPDDGADNMAEPGECWRCRRTETPDGATCAACLAWMGGESDEDPVADPDPWEWLTAGVAEVSRRRTIEEAMRAFPHARMCIAARRQALGHLHGPFAVVADSPGGFALALGAATRVAALTGEFLVTITSSTPDRPSEVDILGEEYAHGLGELPGGDIVGGWIVRATQP